MRAWNATCGIAVVGLIVGACGSDARTDPAPSPPAPVAPAAPAAQATEPAPPVSEAVCRIEEDGSIREYGYRNGRLVRSRDRVHETTYTYEQNRLTEATRRSADGTRTVLVVRPSYDAAGRPARVVILEPGDSDALTEWKSLAFEYDAGGRLVKVVESMHGSPVSEQTFVYRPDGRIDRASTRDPRGTERPNEMRYVFDSEGRLEAIETDTVGWSFTYDGARRDREIRTIEGELVGSVGIDYDDQGRVSARRVVEGRGDSEWITYEGPFAPETICGELGPAPPGIPAEAEGFNWLSISP